MRYHGHRRLFRLGRLYQPLQSRDFMVILDVCLPGLGLVAGPGILLFDRWSDESPDGAATAMNAVDVRCKERYQRPCNVRRELEGNLTSTLTATILLSNNNPLKIPFRDTMTGTGTRLGSDPPLSQCPESIAIVGMGKDS